MIVVAGGGGTTGVAGTDETGVTGVGGGTQAVGGAAGTGDVNGGVGTSGVGGAGGSVPIFFDETGGGGGGYFGGGGGGGKRDGGDKFGAGGGGGSSLVPTVGSTTSGVNTGNGTMTFTYDDGGCVPNGDFSGSQTLSGGAPYYLNCFYGHVFHDNDGKHAANGGNRL